MNYEYHYDRQTCSTLNTDEEICKILFGESERKTQTEKPGIHEFEIRPVRNEPAGIHLFHSNGTVRRKHTEKPLFRRDVQVKYI